MDTFGIAISRSCQTTLRKSVAHHPFSTRLICFRYCFELERIFVCEIASSMWSRHARKRNTAGKPAAKDAPTNDATPRRHPIRFMRAACAGGARSVLRERIGVVHKKQRMNEAGTRGRRPAHARAGRRRTAFRRRDLHGRAHVEQRQRHDRRRRGNDAGRSRKRSWIGGFAACFGETMRGSSRSSESPLFLIGNLIFRAIGTPGVIADPHGDAGDGRILRARAPAATVAAAANRF